MTFFTENIKILQERFENRKVLYILWEVIALIHKMLKHCYNKYKLIYKVYCCYRKYRKTSQFIYFG